jgi:hypothetical protein
MYASFNVSVASNGLLVFVLFIAGPGLAIRIMCATKPHMCQDFRTTQKNLQHIVNLSETARAEVSELTFLGNNFSLQPDVFNAIAEHMSLAERDSLLAAGEGQRVMTTLLPVKTVGVQGELGSF